MAEGGRSIGTVKWFSGQKGYGFISPDEGGEDLFVHQTEIQSEGFRTLREGQRVEFKVDSGEDGRSKAIDVFILARNYNSAGGRGGGRRGGGGYGRAGTGGRSGGGYGGGRGGDAVECYNCGRIGHLARDCYRGSGGDGGFGGYERRGGGGRVRGRGRGGGGGGGGGRECYNCGEEGHLARECPARQIKVD